MHCSKCKVKLLVNKILSILFNKRKYAMQGSKIALVRLYLQVPQAAGQVKILIFLVKNKFFPIYANNFCDAGQVPILRYFEACYVPNVEIDCSTRL